MYFASANPFLGRKNKRTTASARAVSLIGAGGAALGALGAGGAGRARLGARGRVFGPWGRVNLGAGGGR